MYTSCVVASETLPRSHKCLWSFVLVRDFIFHKFYLLLGWLHRSFTSRSSWMILSLILSAGRVGSSSLALGQEWLLPPIVVVDQLLLAQRIVMCPVVCCWLTRIIIWSFGGQMIPLPEQWHRPCDNGSFTTRSSRLFSRHIQSVAMSGWQMDEQVHRA